MDEVVVPYLDDPTDAATRLPAAAEELGLDPASVGPFHATLVRALRAVERSIDSFELSPEQVRFVRRVFGEDSDQPIRLFNWDLSPDPFSDEAWSAFFVFAAVSILIAVVIMVIGAIIAVGILAGVVATVWVTVREIGSWVADRPEEIRP